MPIFNGANFKDFLLTSISILNDEFTDNEFLPSILCCCKSSSSCCINIKPFLVFETFFSLRIFIGVLLHFIELCIIMSTADSSNLTLALAFSLTLCIFLLILVTCLIVYDVKLVKRIRRGEYKEDYDSCCICSSSTIMNPVTTTPMLTIDHKAYMSIFKLSILFLVLFKIVSLLVSIDIYVNSLASEMSESNSFDLFFFGYGICDFGLSIVGIALMFLKFVGDLLIADRGWIRKQNENVTEHDEYWQSSQPYASCLTITFLILFLIITFGIVQKHFQLVVILCVLFALIGLLITSCVLLRCRCSYAAKVNNESTSEKKMSWAQRLSFLSDLCNLLVVLGLCIFLSVYIADTKMATTTTASTVSQLKNSTVILGR